ncbi:Uracil-DNA glycosylase [Peptoniphilus asaccharolyticus DSM 20463]|uniref:Uracil-DNA glycosylase n=1 Tax=Peptoniphilus asaccharolyticus DSM 20463 TaxID=573058 RepID=A0A1W1VKN5_PEPAS|nr:uracil-DNA glycosylase [Peptoniphilus asaccharolyticus]MBL7574462.1 uracil-DNA glycosylase [Peptoniphilus asaccharolyticus]SMB93843.1 Uracil-DNA glycosylase [Peptoniphilus asaccharolyticus DSM 20463]
MSRIIGNSWDELLDEQFKKPYYKNLRELLIEEYKNFQIFPKAEDIFNAFKKTPYENVRCVILGQDPYHNVNQAEGLSFSVKVGQKIPPSLVNIYKELKSDLGYEPPTHGSLVKWAENGVLLLNTTLTVRAHTPMSHSKIGWEILTDSVIDILNKKESPVVFILWGRHAQSKEKLITNPNHLILKAPHPSPLSANRGFFGSKPFSKTNEFLRINGCPEIDWRI